MKYTNNFEKISKCQEKAVQHALGKSNVFLPLFPGALHRVTFPPRFFIVLRFTGYLFSRTLHGLIFVLVCIIETYIT